MSRVRNMLEGGHTPATFPEPPTTPEVPVGGYEEMSKADLKAVAALRRIDVKSKATKPDIIEVLEEADNELDPE